MSGSHRELVLASAGTGKTFHVSSRIIGLLAAGRRPEEILASTFTRKAAGEITDRVLARVAEAALDPAAARALAEHAGADPEQMPTEGWAALLGELCAQLHRFNIGTLDAFFARIAAGLGDDLALPGGWAIADAATEERLRARAVVRLLAAAPALEAAALHRALAGRDAARSTHATILREAAGLVAAHRALADPDPARWTAAWEPFRTLPAGFERERARLAAAFRDAEVPTTKAGHEDKRWRKGCNDTAALLEAGDFDRLLEHTLLVNARDEEPSYHGAPIPPDLLDLLGAARGLARALIGQRTHRRAAAMAELAGRLAALLEEAQRERGAVGFDDVTRAVGAGARGRSDLSYRLDGRIRDVLLDEFQDTATAQWGVLEPMLDALPAGDDNPSIVVVADPKQSIYGWRGGEPRLLEHVGPRYGLDAHQLDRSYRSSQVVLDLVNAVFTRLPENPVLAGSDAATAAAAEWVRAFPEHRAARDLPGHVRIEEVPAAEGEDAHVAVCRRAAALAAELHRAAPAASIALLTRSNATVARLIVELRACGVAASGEGGTPLTDSPAVAALLSLLRLADHPGDGVARFHLASTALGEVVGITDHRDEPAVHSAANVTRRRLVEEGYGPTLAALAESIRDRCAPRCARRIAQLVELALDHDQRPGLRTTEFVRRVETTRIDDPLAAPVRVMTVHQSKGLEFDIVILPQLDDTLAKTPTDTLLHRPHRARPAERAFPALSEEARALFDDVEGLREAADQAARAAWQDALSGLYVAMTRARHALHLLTKPDNPKSKSRSAARLVRAALPEGVGEGGSVRHEAGDPAWAQRVFGPVAAADVPAAGMDAGEPPALRLRPSAADAEAGQVAPSSLAGGPTRNAWSLLRLDRAAADRGTLVHAWFEEIGWLEDGIPTPARLREVAARVAPDWTGARLGELMSRFGDWLADPAIRAALSHTGFPAGSTVEREVPFLHRTGGRLLEGVIDRLVLHRDAGRVVAATILDYKSDAISAEPGALAGLAAHYRPQIDAYREVVASWYALPEERVEGRLIVLEAGAVVGV